MSYEKTWSVIAAMDEKGLGLDEVRTALKEAAIEVAMQPEFGARSRHVLAKYIGIDLAREWRINAAYLAKKTTKEMLALGEKLGIFADPAAEAFLEETLNKKRGKFTSCKNGELVRVFLESDVDLAGKVPQEILDVELDMGPGSGPGVKPCVRCKGKGYIDESGKEDCPVCFGDGEIDDDEQQCRVCGCTENCACEGGCTWAEKDLCSACVGKEERTV